MAASMLELSSSVILSDISRILVGYYRKGRASCKIRTVKVIAMTAARPSITREMILGLSLPASADAESVLKFVAAAFLIGAFFRGLIGLEPGLPRGLAGFAAVGDAGLTGIVGVAFFGCAASGPALSAEAGFVCGASELSAELEGLSATFFMGLIGLGAAALASTLSFGAPGVSGADSLAFASVFAADAALPIGLIGLMGLAGLPGDSAGDLLADLSAFPAALSTLAARPIGLI